MMPCEVTVPDSCESKLPRSRLSNSPAYRRHQPCLNAGHCARRNLILHRNDALRSNRAHLFHHPLAHAEHVDDSTRVLLGQLHVDKFKRLAPLPVDLLLEHLWASDHHLEALTAHRLDEDGQMEQATAEY